MRSVVRFLKFLGRKLFGITVKCLQVICVFMRTSAVDASFWQPHWKQISVVCAFSWCAVMMPKTELSLPDDIMQAAGSCLFYKTHSWWLHHMLAGWQPWHEYISPSSSSLTKKWGSIYCVLRPPVFFSLMGSSSWLWKLRISFVPCPWGDCARVTHPASFFTALPLSTAGRFFSIHERAESLGLRATGGWAAGTSPGRLSWSL